MEPLFVEVSGIKCDNTDCDYIDETVPFQEYREWLNKPCPKCGANLLTEEDFEVVKKLYLVTSVISGYMPEVPEGVTKDDYEKVELELDGKGNLSVKEED